MAIIVAPLRFLERLPLYQHEKPFVAVVTPEVGFNPDVHTNVRLEEHHVPITDIRGGIEDFKLEQCGFQIVPHSSAHLDFQNVEETEAYKRENADWLKEHFAAEHVVCWDFKVRRMRSY
jgi:hypothetical protein